MVHFEKQFSRAVFLKVKVRYIFKLGIEKKNWSLEISGDDLAGLL